MWVIMQDGSAIDNKTGDEMYMNFGSDAITRVYFNDKVINIFSSVADAWNFIKECVDRLNSTE